MKIAILGGGITGLTAAYYLAKKGHKVTLFEKEKVLGGLSAGFRAERWDWYLDKTYRHIFANDFDILNFTKEIGFNKFFFKSPETASLYENSNFQIPISKQSSNYQLPISNYSIYPLDTPLDFLKFPLLSWPQKLRAGLILAFLKLSPFFSFYEKQTSREFLKKTMGDDVWNILWQVLFRNKFGRYAENILASFFWARIKKRTKYLGYIEGGFQRFIDFLENKNKEMGVIIKKGWSIEKIGKRKGVFQINSFKTQADKFEAVISTLPTPILTKIVDKVFSSNYLNQLSKIKHLHAVNLILETKERLLNKTYWLNISATNVPFMILCQHTNFIDKNHYTSNHILYIGWYVDNNDKLLKMRKEEVLNFIEPHLNKINPNCKLQNTICYLFKTPYAQPIFDKEFLKNKPNLKTPVNNFYIANLDMTYPYDRGINYAVRLGKEVAGKI
jgi:protoporphyrinogen oxidase